MINKKTIAVSIVILLGIGYVTLNNKQATSSPGVSDHKPAAVMSVELVSSEFKDWASNIKVSGQVLSNSDYVVSAVNSGQRIVSLPKNPGDFVNKGDVIAKLDTSYLMADVQKAHALLSELQISLALATSEYNRQKQLADEGLASPQALAAALSDMQSSKAKVDQQNSDIYALNLKIKDSNVIAGISGTIYSKLGIEGSVSQAGQELYKIINPESLEAVIDIPVSQASNVIKGSKVLLDLDSEHSYSISRVYPLVDGNSQVIKAVTPVKASSVFKLNSYITGSIILAGSKAHTLPATAVVSKDGFDYVATVDSAHKVKFVKVYSEVRGSLAKVPMSISNVVKEGASFLNENDYVTVVNAE